MAGALKIGIRDLAEFCCRVGDLGYDSGPGVRALDGLHTHQKIQKRYNAVAESEVSVKLATRIDDSEIELGGRIDLLFVTENPPRIEEIKTVYAHGGNDAEDAVHWAQLKCYGACYARAEHLDEVKLSLNLVTLFSQQEEHHSEIFSSAQLDSFLEQTLRQYLRWYRLVEAQRQITRQQAQALEFPFNSFRNQQRGFAAEVYRTIQHQQRLIVEAPTGSGKTISTLFPGLKAIGENQCDQIVYLSAKVSGQQQALKAVELMQTSASYLVIQAKARSCPCNFDESEIDNEGRCQRCLGFYDRLPAAREKCFRQRKLDVAEIQTTATEFSVCPFELALQMLPWVDIVICDFNYVFDPLVQLGYFKNDPQRKLLLIDELHNLVDRSRGMYSASLSRLQIDRAIAADNSRQISGALNAMRRALDRVLRDQDEDESIAEELPQDLLQASQRFSEKLGFDIFSNKRIASDTLEFSKAIFRFQNICQLFGKHHRALGYKPLQTREMKLLCLNAFEFLQECYPMFHAVCGFSATLTPSTYFQQALGLDQDCKSLVLESSFPAQHLGVYIGNYVDTRYRQREGHIDAICESIARCYRVRPGNYLVFFSAYYFMQQVHTRFTELYPEIVSLLQQREFDEAAQQQFLAQFFEANHQLGFAIMGGRFAEGIDYQGDALIGAIIVGVGLPQANSEQQLIQQDFENLRLDGFDYAFRFPGLIRIKQSAGRVIRGEQDRGIVVLLDRRFQQAGYRRHLPAHWNPSACKNTDTLEQSLQAFWKNGIPNDASD
ncbi:MAG: ATP-dependent DNA helicase [Gammaproteobacteria bacterium]|nr:ATP-dependent DNA helicase [Gammaproteobacteria bacterium]